MGEKNSATQPIALVALAGQTRGAIGLSLNFFGYPAYRQAGFFFKKKSDKQIITNKQTKEKASANIMYDLSRKNSATQPIALVALAGQTRGAIGLSLNFLVTFFFKKKSDKQKLMK